MNYSRIIGDNIAIELKNRGLDAGELLKPLGYSESMADKLLEGRLLLAPDELGDIADALQVDVEKLVSLRSPGEYVNLVHNMGENENLEVYNFVLDTFNMYADLKEAVER